jgi:hypothetical protein
LGLKYYDADPGAGLDTVRIRDPKWKKSDLRFRINIPDPQHYNTSRIPTATTTLTIKGTVTEVTGVMYSHQPHQTSPHTPQLVIYHL